jgi:hypothetical protein
MYNCDMQRSKVFSYSYFLNVTVDTAENPQPGFWYSPIDWG